MRDALRPPGLKERLGPGSLRPPPDGITPPDFIELRRSLSGAATNPKPFEGPGPDPVEAEALRPPRSKKTGAGWIHAGPSWGRRAPGGSWAWMVSWRRRWWLQARNEQPLVWHGGHWWWKTRDGWFLLHDGLPWGYRRFRQLEAEGLVHPDGDTKIVYSKDGRRAVVLAPGHPPMILDLETGSPIRSGD